MRVVGIEPTQPKGNGVTDRSGSPTPAYPLIIPNVRTLIIRSIDFSVTLPTIFLHVFFKLAGENGKTLTMCGVGGIRTHILFRAREVLSQLSYNPNLVFSLPLNNYIAIQMLLSDAYHSY